MEALRMPAEWEPHQGLLLCYPRNGHDWPGKYGAIEWAFVEFIHKVALSEKVFVLVADLTTRDKLVSKLIKAGVNMDRVELVLHRTNRSWMRDSGPIVVERTQGVGNKSSRSRQCLSFRFNGWAKYSDHRLDDRVPEVIAQHLNLTIQEPIHGARRVVLEGGAIDVNGRGTLITTEECLLHPSLQVRNPGFGREDYEALFQRYLGINHTIWLKEGIVGDDTHGHVDDITRFVGPERIVTVVEPRRSDDNHQRLVANLKTLKASVLENGCPPEIIELPMPGPVVFDGLRLPASYANFIILNQSVLVPTFNDPNDAEALQVLKACFPSRQIIGIHSVDLIWGLGSLHCLSQQIPA